MNLIGQQKSLLKLAVALLVTSILGVPSALACTNYTPDPTDPNKLGCDGNSAYAYAYTVTGTAPTSTISAVQSGLYWYSGGYGITNSTGDNSHTIDNSGYTDFLALNFTSGPVALSSINFGYVSGDGDFSVLAYKGTGTPTLSGQTIGSLYASGTGAWAMVGDYANSTVGTVSVNASNVTSSWWIISAYNSNYSGGSAGLGIDGGNDYMKVFSVACKEPGNGGKVSEPASLFILGGGLIGMMALRRRRQL